MQTNGTPPRSPEDGEKHRREMRRFYRSAAFFLQIGWSVITPVVLFPWLGSWLSDRFSLGTWPIIVGVVLGLLTAVVTFVRMFRTMLAPALNDDAPADGETSSAAAPGDEKPAAEKDAAARTTQTAVPQGDTAAPPADALPDTETGGFDTADAAMTEKTFGVAFPTEKAAGKHSYAEHSHTGISPMADGSAARPENGENIPTDRKEMRP